MYATMNLKFINSNTFAILHDILDHLGSVLMRIVIENSNGHLLKEKKNLQCNELLHNACS